MELSAKLLMVSMVYIIVCVGTAVSRSVHKSWGHHHHRKGSRHVNHDGVHQRYHGSRLVDMEQAFMDTNDPMNQVDSLDDHPITKRHNDDFRSDVKDLQNCAVCNYTVSLFPKSEVYDVPEELIEVTCNEESVGKSCSNTGLDYICMQTFSHIKFVMKGNPREAKTRKINTGCVCALRMIESLKPKRVVENYY